MDKKECTGCKKLLDFSNFYKDKYIKQHSGCRSKCKLCFTLQIRRYPYIYKKSSLDRVEYQKKYQKIWRQNNRDKRIMYRHTRRMMEKKLYNSYSVEEWIGLKKKYDYKCLCCKQQEPNIKLTIDHIIPIKLGGNNTINNIQPLCTNCNSHKHLGREDFR